MTWRGRRPVARRTPGQMNRMEAQYAARLDGAKAAGEIEDFAFERVTLKLAPDTRYTPDFLVVYDDHFEFHEAKGFFRDDAAVKLKVAAEMFPWFRFVLARQKPKREGGGWELKEVGLC